MIIKTADAMERLGADLGRQLRGGEVIELVGDVGAGKTTLVRGLARGLGVTDEVASPSFTISCNYDCRDGLTLRHYDFYRLLDAGIMADELAEATTDHQGITVLEWSDIVQGILPDKRLIIAINYLPTDGREVHIQNTTDTPISLTETEY